MAKKPGGEDLTIVFHDDVAKQMAADPELAEVIRDFCANVRQAAELVKEGRYETMEDAMEGITGQRPRLIAALNNDNDEENSQ